MNGTIPTPTIITSSGSDDCNHGPNLPTLTYGLHTGFDLPYGLSLRARG